MISLQMACHLRGAPNNVVYTAGIVIQAALHAHYWALPQCGHIISAVNEPQTLDGEPLIAISGLAN
jgi:hypothetical protein